MSRWTHRSNRFVETAAAWAAGLLLLCAIPCAAGEGAGGADGEIPRGAPEEVFRKAIADLKKDRDNILAQTKRLLEQHRTWEAAMRDFEQVSKDRADLLARVEKLNGRAELQMEEIEAAKKEIDQAMDRMEDLLARQDELEKEKITIEEQYSKSRMGKQLKEFKEDRKALRAKSEELEQDLAKTKSDLEKLSSASESEKKNLVRQVEKLHKESERKTESYEERLQKLQSAFALVQKEKEYLDHHIANLPGKYAALSREKHKLVEDTADMHYNLGVFYAKRKEYRRALAEFEEAVRLKPDHKRAMFNVAHYYAAVMKDREKAVEHFRKYLDISPDAEDRSEVLKYINTWETWAGREARE